MSVVACFVAVIFVADAVVVVAVIFVAAVTCFVAVVVVIVIVVVVVVVVIGYPLDIAVNKMRMVEFIRQQLVRSIICKRKRKFSHSCSDCFGHRQCCRGNVP